MSFALNVPGVRWEVLPDRTVIELHVKNVSTTFLNRHI